MEKASISDFEMAEATVRHAGDPFTRVQQGFYSLGEARFLSDLVVNSGLSAKDFQTLALGRLVQASVETHETQGCRVTVGSGKRGSQLKRIRCA